MAPTDPSIKELISENLVDKPSFDLKVHSSKILMIVFFMKLVFDLVE